MERKTKQIKDNKSISNEKVENIQKEKVNDISTLDPKMISNIRNDWTNLIQAVCKHNFSLGSFLKVCDPIDIQDGKVVLVCKYNFHKEKLKDLKNKLIIEDAAEKLYKAKVFFDLVLYDDLSDILKSRVDNKKNGKAKQKEVTTPDLAKQALNVFGGNTI